MNNREYIKGVYQKNLSLNNASLRDDDIQLQYILKYVPKDKESFILDAGSGTGRYANKLAQLGYRNICGIDFLEKKPDQAFIYTQGSIDSLPYVDNYFDFIYANSVIYYLKYPENGVKEFQRVLRPGCLVIITIHTKYSLFTLERVIKRSFGLTSVEHLRGVSFRSASEYVDMFKKNGFKIIWLDGYQLSYLLYPLYLKVAHFIAQRSLIRLPRLRPQITKNEMIAHTKSIIGYHAIIIARKL